MAIKKKTKIAAPEKKPAPAKKTVKPAAVKTPAPVTPKKETVLVSSPFWNIWDAGNQYKVRVSIPGLTKKNIKVYVNGNNLTVSCKKELETKTEKKNYLIREYSFDSWSKTISLPKKVNEEDVKISYKDGLLKIGLNKL